MCKQPFSAEIAKLEANKVGNGADLVTQLEQVKFWQWLAVRIFDPEHGNVNITLALCNLDHR